VLLICACTDARTVRTQVHTDGPVELSEVAGMEQQVRCLHIDHHMVIARRPPANRDTGQSSPTAHARVRAPPPPDERAAECRCFVTSGSRVAEV
jgi:hypothetical protein